jgi:hypothetical protein
MQMSTYHNKLAAYLNNASTLHAALIDMTARKRELEEEVSILNLNPIP